MSEAEQSEFWAFTLASYPREGVQQAVIDLQNRRGADVNLLFFCCYVASRGADPLTRDDFVAADGALDPWRRQVTLPLRALRDGIKGSEALWTIPGAPEVRGKVLGAEIESERVAQGILEGLIPAVPPGGRPDGERLRIAVANFRAYFAFLSVGLESLDREALRTLAKGTFPDCGAEELAAAFAAVTE